MRLVAVMQYLRVACVGFVASLVARAWLSGWRVGARFDRLVSALQPPGPLLATLAIGVGGAVIGVKSKIPAGALLVPLFDRRPAFGCAMSLTITLPPWLLAICYAVVGWSIGLRFTRETILYAWNQLPRHLAVDFHADRALRRPRLSPCTGGGNGPADRLSRDQPRRRRRGGDHRRLVPGRPCPSSWRCRSGARFWRSSSVPRSPVSWSAGLSRPDSLSAQMSPTFYCPRQAFSQCMYSGLHFFQGSLSCGLLVVQREYSALQAFTHLFSARTAVGAAKTTARPPTNTICFSLSMFHPYHDVSCLLAFLERRDRRTVPDDDGCKLVTRPS